MGLSSKHRRIGGWMAMLVLAAMMVSSAACGNQNKKSISQLAKEECKQRKSCDTQAFEAQWDSVSECRQQTKSGMQTVIDTNPGCKKEAKKYYRCEVNNSKCQNGDYVAGTCTEEATSWGLCGGTGF